MAWSQRLSEIKDFPAALSLCTIVCGIVATARSGVATAAGKTTTPTEKTATAEKKATTPSLGKWQQQQAILKCTATADSIRPEWRVFRLILNFELFRYPLDFFALQSYEPPSILHHLLLHRWVVNEPRKWSYKSRLEVVSYCHKQQKARSQPLHWGWLRAIFLFPAVCE